MTCYQRHMGDVFEALGLEYDKPSRARVDAAIRQVLDLGPDVHCPEVWSAIKALPADQRAGLAARIAAVL